LFTAKAQRISKRIIMGVADVLKFRSSLCDSAVNFFTAKAQGISKRIIMGVADVLKLRSSLCDSAVNCLPRGMREMKTARRSEPF
jgi:hypothetical protein